jgi:hypothetical protein
MSRCAQPLLQHRRAGALCAAFAIALATIPGAFAECSASGTVLYNSGPVNNAEILEVYAGDPVLLGKTDPQGKFRVTPSTVPPRWTKAVLIVTHPGFNQLTLALPMGADRCPRLGSEPLNLTESGGGGGGNAAGTGLTLFVAPYQLSGRAATRDVAAFNATIVEAIYLNVQKFLTQMEESVTGPLGDVDDVGVRPLPAAVFFTDAEGIRRAGSDAHALGVIAGIAVDRSAPGVVAPIELRSRFLVIPQYPAFQEYDFQIQDELPGNAVDPIALGDRLRDEWGKRATIALLVRALREANETGDKRQFRVIRSWIIGLRSRLGPEEALLARELEALKRDVETHLSQ